MSVLRRLPFVRRILLRRLRPDHGGSEFAPAQFAALQVEPIDTEHAYEVFAVESETRPGTFGFDVVRDDGKLIFSCTGVFDDPWEAGEAGFKWAQHYMATASLV